MVFDANNEAYLGNKTLFSFGNYFYGSTFYNLFSQQVQLCNFDIVVGIIRLVTNVNKFMILNIFD